MKEAFILLVTCSINMSLIAGLLFIVSPILSKYYKANVRYYTWFIIILGMLIPIRPQTEYAFFRVNLFYLTSSQVEREEQKSNVLTEEMMLSNDILLEQEKNKDSSENEKLKQNLDIKQMNREQEIEEKRSYLGILNFLKQNGYFECSLFLIWILGIILVLGKQVRKHIQFIRFLKHWEEEVTTLELLNLLDEIKQKRKITTPISLFTCEGISTPMLIGLIKPKIILPKETYQRSELAFILEHECVHYKRKDLWYKCLVVFVRAVHWFNPFVSIICREIDSICEISCDEMVLEEKEKEQRMEYIETILGIVSCKKKNQSVFSTTFYGGKQYMKKRISSIINSKKKKVGIAFTAIVLVSTMGSNIIVSAQQDKLKEIPWSYFATISGNSNINIGSADVVMEDSEGEVDKPIVDSIKTESEKSLEEQAKQEGYKYLKVGFNYNEDKATDKKIARAFDKNHFKWNDKVWVEFADGSWIIYWV